MTLESFQVDLLRQIAHPRFVDSRSYTTDGGSTDVVEIVPKGALAPGEKILGVIVHAETKFTNGGSTTASTPAAASDNWDIWCKAVHLRYEKKSAIRSETISRRGTEAIEQIVLNANKRTYGSQSLLTTITHGNAPTAKGDFVVPCGGDSLAMSIDFPTVGTIYNARVTFTSRLLKFYTIIGQDPTVISFANKQTASLGSGTNSLLKDQPDNLSPDFQAVLNSANVTAAQFEAHGGMLLNFQDAGQKTLMQQMTPSLAPTFNTHGANVLWVTQSKQALKSALVTTTGTNTLEMLWVSADEGPEGTSPPPPSASPTSATPAADLGRSGGGGGVRARAGARVVGGELPARQVA